MNNELNKKEISKTESAVKAFKEVTIYCDQHNNQCHFLMDFVIVKFQLI